MAPRTVWFDASRDAVLSAASSGPRVLRDKSGGIVRQPHPKSASGYIGATSHRASERWTRRCGGEQFAYPEASVFIASVRSNSRSSHRIA